MKKSLLVFVFFVSFVSFVHARECEVSEAFLEWSKLDSEERSKYITPEYCKSEGLNKVVETTKSSKKLASNYPSSYTSLVSRVKNAGVNPMSYSFASSSVLESFLYRKYGNYSYLSAGHLNYMESQSFYDITSNPKGANRTANEYGDFDIAGLYYINRYGPVYESDIATSTGYYTLPNVNSTYYIDYYDNRVNVNNIEYVYRSNSGACTSSEINKIKSLIYNYGPIGANMYFDDSYMGYNNSYLYKSDYKYTTINESVNIIGWNDNYSSSNFNSVYKPKNNGAFIVQASKGPYFANNGTFYVSYEDDEICSTIFGIRDADYESDDNKYVYVNDVTRDYSVSDATMNVFTKSSKTDEVLKKVSFEVSNPGKYKIYYYEGNAAKDNVKLDKMILIGSGTSSYKGWISVRVTEGVVIPSTASVYSICVYQENGDIKILSNREPKIDTNGNIYYDYSPDTFKKNISYEYRDNKWVDLYSAYDNEHYKAAISAFTDNTYLSITSSKVEYSSDDYLDILFSVKANNTTYITSAELYKDNKVIASKSLNTYIYSNRESDFSLRKNGLSNLENGKYTLRVNTNNGYYTVKQIDIKITPITSISITNKKGLELSVGNTVKLDVSITPSDYNSVTSSLTWLSSNSNIASVDQKGVVTGKSVGSAIIVVRTSNNISASYEIKVVKSVGNIVTNRNYMHLGVGEYNDMTYYVTPTDTTDDKTVKWKVGHEDKIKLEVIKEGTIRVTALSPGKTWISATTSNGITKTYEVLVKGFAISESYVLMELYTTHDMIADVIDNNYNVNHNVSWSVLDSDIALIDSNGRLVAKKLGSTTIIAIDQNGRIATSKVVVTKIQASSFKVSSISDKTYTGKNIKPSIKVTYDGRTLTKDKDYTLKYSNNKKPGKATITISAKNTKLYEGSKKVSFVIKPKKETISSLKTKSKTITVKYNSQPNTLYQVSYRIKGSDEWKVLNVSKTSKKITGLKKGKKYEVRVRAYIKIDDKTYNGSWSKTKTIKCK